MKTSKRLLSFFLAVVMVVTTCSVGFAAFAAEPDGDEVFTFNLSDGTGDPVDITYDGLNELVNEYAPMLIELLRGTLEGLGMNVDAIVASESPIKALLGQLSPTLIGALGTGDLDTSMSAVVGNSDKFNNLRYSYLEDDNAAMDFWTLYQFCSANKSSQDKSIKDFCEETLDTLDGMLKAYTTAESEYDTKFSKARTEIEKALGSALQDFGDEADVIVYNYLDDDPNYATASSLLGFILTTDPSQSGPVPVSYENLGNVICTGAGNITFSEFVKEAEANENVYNEVDLNPFIEYVSFYGEKAGVLDAGSKFSLAGAIYYYYNEKVASARTLALNTLTSDGNSYEITENIHDLYYSYLDATGLTEEQLNQMGVSVPEDYTITLEPSKFWLESYKEAFTYSDFTDWMNFMAVIFNQLGMPYDIDITDETAYIWEGIYELTPYFYNIPVMPTVPSLGSADIASPEYTTAVDNLFIEGKIYDDVAEKIGLLMTDDTWLSLVQLRQDNSSVSLEEFKALIEASSDYNALVMFSLDDLTEDVLADITAEANEKAEIEKAQAEADAAAAAGETVEEVEPYALEISDNMKAFAAAVKDNYSEYKYKTTLESLKLSGPDDSDWKELYDLRQANPDMTTQQFQSLVVSSSSITNEVVKYSSSSISNDVLFDLTRWTPGEPITSNMQTFANVVNNNFYKYAVRHILQGYDLGTTAGSSDFTDALIDLYDAQIIVSNIETTYEWDNFASELAGDTGIDIVNALLNNLIDSFLAPDSQYGPLINQVIGALLETNIDLASVLSDIYKDLAEKPVETIFKLAPVLVVLLDELIIPFLFNAPASGNLANDRWYDANGGTLYSLLGTGAGILADMAQSTGDMSVGIGQLRWDLNTVVPTLIHWLRGDNNYTYTYYNISDVDETTQKCTYGTPVTGNFGTKYDASGNLNVDENGNRRIPVILNIYVVDSALANASISDLTGETLEIVNELATFAGEVVDEYVAQHGNDIRGYAKDTPTAPIQKGLNNLFVSLPQIIDGIGKKFIAKYDIGSDWGFGNIETTDDGFVVNTTLSEFKSLAENGDSKDVLSSFVNIFINNWFNAITDIFNDVVSDENNKITSEIPIVTSVLNELDLFGETSILTDLLNGFFLMTRTNDYSFTFETQANGYVGLDTNNAYFLLANLDKIINVLQNIKIEGSNDDGTTNPPDEPTGGTSGFDIGSIINLIKDSINTNLPAIESDSENIDGATGLLKTVDSVLSTLLSNTYMNGYQVDEVDGILSGVATFLTNTFGEDEANEVWYLVTEYLKAISAGSTNEDGSANADANGPVDPDKVYTAKNLSNIVTQTYVFVEKLINDNLSPLISGDDNHLLTSAVNGIISPSTVAIRSNGSIDEKVMNELSWTQLATETNYGTDLGYKFDDGDKDAFYTNLVDSLGIIPSVLGVLLVDAGIYNNALSPVLGELCGAMNIEYTATLPEGTTGEEATLVVIKTLSDILGSFLDTPVSGILELVRALVNIVPDSFLGSVIKNTIEPVTSELYGLVNIVNYLSPTLAGTLKTTFDNLVNQINTAIPSSNILLTLIGNIAGTDLSGYSIDEIIALLEPYTDSNEKLLLALYTILVDVITDDSIFGQIVGDQYPWLTELVTKYDSATILNLIKDLVGSIQSPKELEWILNQNNQQTNTFTYPTGITSTAADSAVESLDELVANLFPLLKELGVVDNDNLADLLNGFIFTNANITALAKAVYGGIEEASTNNADGIFVFSPAQFANYLTDSSYGTTFSSAANALKKCSTWSQVETINWGFTDGSAKAQQGFVNALAALTRPVNDILAAFLAQGDVNLSAVAVQLIKDFDIDTTTTSGDTTVRIVLKDSTLTIYVDNNANENAKTSSIQVDLAPVIKTLSSVAIAGGNGYESAIIPLLNAFNVDCKSYDEYLSDYKTAKDNLVIDILNPIVDFLNSVTSAPVTTITEALPKLAQFLDNNGLGQAVNNLLAPITDIIRVLNENGINVDSLIEQIAGKSLKDILEGLIGIDLGDLNLELTNLSESLNIQDILIPLVNKLLSDNNINITLGNINWSSLASLENKGQVLITVLRYVESTLINNAAAINTLLRGIDAISSNETILNVLDSVFGQISTAKKDDIVLAVFYLLLNQPTNAYFDSSYTPKQYEFKYPMQLDQEFLDNLGSQFDGIVNTAVGMFLSGGLSGLVSENLYTDSLISTIATGLYGAIENVNISDSMSLIQLLAMTDIDFSTDNFADLLVNKDYGKTYADAANVIRNAGSWSKVDASSLSWGVTDKDSFLNALAAVLRPLYGVLDVLLNNGSLGLFNLVYLPGSNGYTSAIVPLLYAFGCTDIATEQEYKSDVAEKYDNILLDILNPLFDKVEELLGSPIQTLADMLPGIAKFIANDGLIQIITNLITPVRALLDALNPVVDVNDVLSAVGLDIAGELKKLGLVSGDYTFNIYNLASSLKAIIGKDNIVNLLNIVLGKINVNGAPLNIQLPSINWDFLASLDKQDQVIITVLRYIESVLITNADTLQSLISGIDAVKSNDLILNIVNSIFGKISSAKSDEIVIILLTLLMSKSTSASFDESGFTSQNVDFEYPENVDSAFASTLGSKLDGVVNGVLALLLPQGLSSLLSDNLYKDSIISAIAKGLYGAIEGVKINDSTTLTQLLAKTNIDFSTTNVANLLVDSAYGQAYSSAANVIRNAGSWSNVNVNSLSWGVTDRDSFLHALVAVLRPLYGVLDVLLNSGSLGLFHLIYIPGSNGYTSTIVPLLEALNCSNIKSQQQYEQDMQKEYDNILLDILNPLFDMVEELLGAPIQTLADILPSLARFIENDGLVQIITNLVTPVRALLDTLKPIVDVNEILSLVGLDIAAELQKIGLVGSNYTFDIYDLAASLKPIIGKDNLVNLINTILGLIDINGTKLAITLPQIDWAKLGSLNDQGQVIITVLRYIEKVLINNADEINSLLRSIDAIKNNKLIMNILDSVFNRISNAKQDDILLAIFYFLLCQPTNEFFDYSGFEYKEYDFEYPTTVDMDFLTVLGPMLDGLIGGLVTGGLSGLVAQNVYKDSIISSIATGLYSAIESVKIDDSTTLTELLAMTGIDFSTDNVANLLENKDYGQTYSSAASVIRKAGSWSKVNADSLSWGVTDRDSFVHALSAVLRPLYGVLDVLLNDASLGLFNIVSVPGSDGYSSTIVPLLEAFGCYNIKTQYQYRQDIAEKYDNILIDVLNPLLDKVEDLLNAPIQTLADMLPNLALFFANDGLLQIIENLLTPIRALLDAIRPVADVNEILSAAGLDIAGELQKLGLVGSDYTFDIYDLSASLRPLIGKDNIVSLLNTVLGMIKIGGAPLGIELMPIDWYQLASHGEFITDEASQAATIGGRIYVDADPNEVLIAVLRYLVETINYKDNYTTISNLIGGLIGGADDSISSVVDNVLSILTGETDEVISELCDVLQTLA